MNIKERFLSLTTRTYPHGTESELYHLLPSDLQSDEFGNLYKIVGDKPTTMFTCHLDTATSALTNVNHVIDGNIIKTDGGSILGADDKAGVTICMHMIENNVTGLYYFFLGEEVGCVGSRKLSNKHKTTPIPEITKVVSFDRRGYNSVITHQLSTRCCSESFGNALSDSLNNAGLLVGEIGNKFEYSNDPTGIYTDSAQFISIYPECTNISVGYKNEHTFNESQDIVHLEKLAKACVLVNWESLPVERDINKPDKYEYESYPRYRKYDDDDFYDYDYDYTKSKMKTNQKDKNWFIDEYYDNEVSYVITDTYTNKVLEIDISQDRVDYEMESIISLVNILDVDYDNIEWDGFTLKVHSSHGHITEANRNELIEYLPELDFWKDIIKDTKSANDKEIQNNW